MDEWKTIDDIIAEFELNASKFDLKALKKELKSKRNKIHPDKTHGTFKSEEHKAKYFRLSHAIDFLDQLSSKELAMVPVYQITSIIEAVGKVLQPSTQINQAESNIRSMFSSRISTRIKIPRISSVAIGALSAVLLVFWDYIRSDTAAYFLAGSESLRITWLVLLLTMCMVYIWTWLYEQRSQGYMEYLLSEASLTTTLYRLIGSGLYETSENGIEFTKTALIGILRNRDFYYHRMFRIRYFVSKIARAISPTFLPIKTASDCADLILAKLQERKVVRRINRVEIQEWYQISKDMIEKIQTAYYHEPEHI